MKSRPSTYWDLTECILKTKTVWRAWRWKSRSNNIS